MSIPGAVRMARACLMAGLVLAVWLAVSSPAGATTLRRMDLPELVHRAERVVHARAVDNKVYWNADGTQIHTDTQFDLLDEAKGKGPKRLTVTMYGGRIDPVEMSAEGTPRFAVGEEVLLFTSPGPDGKKNLVGYSQGVMRIHEDPQTGQKIAVTDTPVGTTYMEMAGGKAQAVRPTRLQAPVSALLDQIRQMVAGDGAAAGLSLKPIAVAPSAPEGGRP